ncbi:hypothetical protein PCH_Pc22g12660 [Penicillium rubens Wisconsin 54-1255]|uniref:Uncharacterized protein n=1 Tax=Penicillium rubens (strain ATCC 28089 / DSM 1075 / NRRL 1951 / Wisconsin 54-1255) TaxID=500485 RepID=B6HRY3_PENRW|nr:hypothetical protein PCH_Pc22g12660 [Penicillium rubens Wisconsin 54-1255]
MESACISGKPPQKSEMHVFVWETKASFLQAYDLHYIVQSGIRSGQKSGPNQTLRHQYFPEMGFWQLAPIPLRTSYLIHGVTQDCQSLCPTAPWMRTSAARTT